ncbi:MAG: hypothetical protein DHS20C18_08940 [Saprospiraceae bacterium]|nr:MAG: hypothetical protein DHS20C18_08940 [Saprospiraceae bacterium]
MLVAQSECQKNLEISRELYGNGLLEEVAHRLKFCAFNKNLVRPLRREILNLLTQTYLFLDETEEAKKCYQELLTLDPFNRVNPTVPEIKYLENQYETFPSTTYSIFWGLQVLSKVHVQAFNSPPGVTKEEVNYERQGEDPLGWQAGFNFAVKLFNTNLDASFGYTHAKYTYHYNAQLKEAQGREPGVRGTADLSFLEQHRWSQFSLSLVYQFVSREKVIHRILIPYAFAGISTNVLHNSSAQIVAPSLTFQDLPPENNANFGIVDISDLRNHTSTSLLLGGGFRFHFKRFFLQFDVRYNRFLSNLANEKNRSSNDLLRETFNYIDDDFTLNSTGFGLGMGFYLFKSQKRIR